MTDFKSVDRVFDVYNLFKAASGATLNINKTQILLLDCASLILHVPENYSKHVTKCLKVYGVNFSKDGPNDSENLASVFKVLDILKTKRVGPEISYIARSRITTTYYLAKLW